MVNAVAGYTLSSIKHMAMTEKWETVNPKFFDASVVLALEDGACCIELLTDGNWVHATTSMETLKRQTLVRAQHYNDTMGELIRGTGRLQGPAPVFPVTQGTSFCSWMAIPSASSCV